VRADYLDTVVWDHITGMLADPSLIRTEIDKRLATARTTDPATQQRTRLETALLRARETNLRNQTEALDAQLADHRVETAYNCPVLVRYADLTAFYHSRQQAEQVKGQLAEWLKPRGLAFNEDKTRIVHVNQGCDFLGFNIRRYHNKLPVIKPSPDAVRRIRTRLRAEMWALRGGKAASVLKKLTPIIREWSAYYRTQVSSEIFSDLDNYMWTLLYKWAKHSHPKKPR
jgi:Group II intron, maturase-specific domain